MPTLEVMREDRKERSDHKGNRGDLTRCFQTTKKKNVGEQSLKSTREKEGNYFPEENDFKCQHWRKGRKGVRMDGAQIGPHLK